MGPEVLGRPLALPSGERLGNRLVKAAMTEGLADERGHPTSGLARLYQRWSGSGVGLLISGNVAVDRDHLERPGNVILDGATDAELLASLRRWVAAARAEGAGFWLQLSHAGRQTPRRVNRTPDAPSAVRLAIPGKQFGMPRAMDEATIVRTVERFANAAKIAQEVGCSGVQIHAAHGYLLSQFLSPRANVRNDEWGGSLARRARLLLRIVEEVRAVTGPRFSIGVKLNSADFQRGGFEVGDSLQVADWLAEAGIDLLEISGGTYEQPRMMDMDGLEPPDMNGMTPSTAAREGYFVEFARAMRGRVQIPLLVTGGFRTAAGMQRALTEDGVALIGIGRPLCTDFDGPKRLLREGGALDRPEANLRIGPGWLGPQSEIAAIKALNGFGSLYWFYQQLRAVAQTGEGRPSLGLLDALRRELSDQRAWLAAAGRRAR